MLVLGIVGGVASGKSLVSATLARWGAVVIDADKLGHEVLQEPAVIDAARERWGSSVATSNGQLDRKAIAQRVFGNDATAAVERHFLEQLTHPRIAAKMREKVSELATRGDVDVVVLDAALLLEAGWNEYCDRILYVDAPPLIREQRAVARGWSAVQLAAREAAQMPLSQKRAAADIVIDNADSPEKTLKQLEAAWHSLMAET
jgi:dephospho-CoA kinase